LKEELASFSFFGFEKLGEFPLVEGSFKNLIYIGLSREISSLDDKNRHILEFYFYFVVFLIDRGILSDFVARNNQELKVRSNYGKLKKFN